MRRYEIIIIMNPDLTAEEREPVLKRIQDVIKQQDGYLAFIDDWGPRKLAYEIKKKARGHYLRFDFCGTAAIVDEMERFFRIDDRILKYMTVLLDKIADIEKIKEEVAVAQSRVAAAEETQEPADTKTPEQQAEPTVTETPEEQTEASSAQTPEDQPESSATQTDSPAIDEDQTARAESEEEIK